MNKIVIYIHGKGGNAEESVHYKSLFSDCDVVGLNYTAQFPWEAKKEFPPLFDLICKNYKSVQVIANSIGAYLAMNALSDKQIEKAYFVSPETSCQGLFNQIHKNPQKRCQKHRMAPDTSFDRLHFSVQQVFAEIRIVWQLVDIWLPAPLDFG